MKEYYTITPKGKIVKRKFDLSNEECLFDFMLGKICSTEEQCLRYEKDMKHRILECIEECENTLILMGELERDV
jgi:hypothetical protein